MADVVLITGASEGIGRATAFTFARGGYRLALAARTAETLRQTAIELEQSLNAEVLAVPTDVTQPEQVQNLVERTLERYGRIDCLINNAGICLKGPFLQTTLEHWQALMAVNFWGYLYTIRAVLPDMLKRKKGQIINVGSVGGKMPLPQMSAYCASKYAVSGLTEALRLELQPHGIQVIGVHPGIVSSNFLKRAIFLDEGGDGVLSRWPIASLRWESPRANATGAGEFLGQPARRSGRSHLGRRSPVQVGGGGGHGPMGSRSLCPFPRAGGPAAAKGRWPTLRFGRSS